MDGIALHRQAMLQSILRHSIKPARLVRIGEVICRQSAFRARKEIVAHAVEVCDPRVAEVDVAEVTAADAIPRKERFPEAQRTPAESGSESKPETEAPTRPAKPSHQR